MLDIFNDDAFSLSTLTARINKTHYVPGQVGQLGLFEETGVSTTTVIVEMRDGKLGLVEPTTRGGPGETVDDVNRDALAFRIDHFQRDDAVMADEVQGVRAFGSPASPGEGITVETLQSKIDEKNARHRRDLEMTHEHLRVGAIKGLVTSKSGNVLINIPDRFGVTVPTAVALNTATETTDVVRRLQEGVIYPMEDRLDEPYSGMVCLTGRDLHTAVWRHPSVKETFVYHTGASELRMDVPDEFTLAGIRFIRYRTGSRVTQVNGGAPFIAPDEGWVVPQGVAELFITRFAPADYNETVNTIGLPFYSKQIPMRNDKGTDLEIQTNPIHLCTRPDVPQRITL